MRRFASVAAAIAVASAAPCRAQGGSLSCSACHVSSSGGALTQTGREYRWRANGADDELAGYHAGISTRFSSASGASGAGGGSGASEGSDGGSDAQPSGFGHWSGESSVFTPWRQWIRNGPIPWIWTTAPSGQDPNIVEPFGTNA